MCGEAKSVVYGGCFSAMDEDWAAPLLKDDCLFSITSCSRPNDLMHGLTADGSFVFPDMDLSMGGFCLDSDAAPMEQQEQELFSDNMANRHNGSGMAYAPANNGPMCSGGGTIDGQLQPQYGTRASDYSDAVDIKSEPSDSPSSGQ
jgi:hypothetical protein